MESSIDRRQNGDSLFWYVVQNPHFFEDLGTTGARDFKQIIENLTPTDWMVEVTGIWLHVYPPQVRLPLQGFKIHISATSLTAAEVLRRVVPIFIANNTAFKLMAEPRVLEFATCKNYGRGGSGKFITVYPKDSEDFATLIRTLDRATNDLTGPYILSDKRYANNKVLFYRYGGFAPRSVLNVFGEKMLVIENRDGQLVPDIRTPFFQLPDGVEDPFPSEQQQYEGEVRLKNRYVVKGTYKQSNSGGVYEAVDEETGHTVVIKEARPHINVTRDNNQDAIAMLRKEASVLQKLEPTGYVPKLIDLFPEWEHLFLVEEHLQGIPLSSFRAVKKVALVLQNDPNPEAVTRFCEQVYLLTKKMIDALQACHREGVLMGDLSPHNILVDDDLNIKLIDFEAARILGESASSGLTLFTPGFTSSSRLSGTDLSPQDDFFSLGSVIYSLLIPVQEFFSLNPSAAELFVDEITRDFGIPEGIKEVISALVSFDVKQARTIVESAIADLPTPMLTVDRSYVRSEIPELVDGISQFILNKTDVNKPAQLWPSDYRLYSTNPLSVAYGALGTALYLKAALGELPADAKRWIDRQRLTLDDYAPGLFVGLSGIAWALEELDFHDKARKVISLALQSPLLFDGPDLFYGAAGSGMASLYFFKKTSEQRFLNRARELGDSIMSKASFDEKGYYWTNVDGGEYLGYAHGGSGIALFLLQLYLATGDGIYLSCATGAMDYEIAHAFSDKDQLAWGRVKDDTQESPYWRFGTSGVGSALIRFYALLGEKRYKELAEKAARSAAMKYTVFPSQFVGLSGIGEFLIDMYNFTGEQKYLHDAYKVADGVRLFQIKRPEGIAFPGEELLRISTDFGTGSAGIGMFLLRLLRPQGRLFYEFDVRDRSLFETNDELALVAGCRS